MKTKTSGAVIVAVLLLGSMSVQAGLLATSLPGNTVVYKNIAEDISGAGTYGVPVVTGDILDFDPLGLGVSASGGAIDYNDAQLNFQILAKDQWAVTEVKFAELGDYLLAGPGGAGTYASVSATFFVNILEIDGVAPVAPINYSVSQTFANVAMPGDAGTGLWSGDVNFDIGQIITDAGQTYEMGATWVSVVLDNIMLASSEAGTISQIKKKDANGFTVTSYVVPEPASMALLVGASSAIVFVRRRLLA